MSDTEADRLELRLKALIEAEHVTQQRCRKTGLVDGFVWPKVVPAGRPRAGRRYLSAHRTPPLPFHGFIHKGAGTCRVCGQPTKPPRTTWHRSCTSAYLLWTKPSEYAGAIAFRQGGLCPVTAAQIGPPAQEYFGYGEVDHDVPLYRVAREHAGEPWFELLRFWGLSNLRTLSRAAHLAKCAEEARERSRAGAQQEALPL